MAREGHRSAARSEGEAEAELGAQDVSVRIQVREEEDALGRPEGVDHRTRHRRAVWPRAPVVRRILAHDPSSGSLSAARVSAGRISSRSVWIWAAWAMDRSGWNVR